MSAFRFISNLVFASLVVVELSFGLSKLVETYDEIRPTNSRCEIAFSREVRATPCERLNGVLTVGATRPESFVGIENLGEIIVICFILGALFAAVATGAIYARHLRYLRSSTTLSSTIPSAFGGKIVHYLTFLSENRHVHSFQTFLSLSSLVIWAVALCSHDDISRMLNFFDPDNSVQDTLTIATWYSCGSRRFVVLALDVLVQGSVTFNFLVWVLSPIKPQAADYRLAAVDLLHASSVVWALPIAIHSMEARPYNVYLLSGCIRAWRIFDGVPDLARHYKLLVSDTTSSEPGRFQNSSTVSSKQLLAGQFAILTKILFFLGGASLLLIAIEGWPCEYFIQNKSPCECFPEFKSFDGTIYFVFTTMTTVGFGDIVPRTSVGRLAVIALIVTGVYLAPTWITQIEKQYKHYRNAKRAEQSLAMRSASLMSSAQLAAHRPVENIPEMEEGEEEGEPEETMRKREDVQTMSEREVVVEVDSPPKPNRIMSPRHIEVPQGLGQKSEISNPDLTGEMELDQSLLPTPQSPLIQNSPLARQGSLKNTFGTFLKRLGSSKRSGLEVELEEVPAAMEVSEVKPVAHLETPEWERALRMLSKQQDQLTQQQALLQYLLDFLLQVCTSDTQKVMLRQVLATVQRQNHTELDIPYVAHPSARRPSRATRD